MISYSHFISFLLQIFKKSFIHLVSISSVALQNQANTAATKRRRFVLLHICQNSKARDITDFCPVHRNPVVLPALSVLLHPPKKK